MTTSKNRLSDDLAAEIATRAEGLRERLPTLSKEQAYARVLEENPDLYTQHEHVRSLEAYLDKP